jgi:uncharacterized protein (TIGR02996 family)
MHPDQAALYRGILANPHADLPRLVYADWLEENGRAERAEFIRVQIELANATPADDGYCDLVEREIELKAILEDELRAELQQTEGRPWQHHRGLPHTGGPLPHPTGRIVSRTGLTPGLLRMLNDREWNPVAVSLAFTQDDQLATWPVAGSAVERPLRELVLDSSCETNAAFSHLLRSPGLYSLRRLEFDAGSGGVSRLTILVELLRDQAIAFPELRHLTLKVSNAHRYSLQLLARAPFWETLTSFDLECNIGVDQDDWAEFFRAWHAPALRHLLVRATTFQNKGGLAFAEKRALANLRVLDLSPGKLSATAFRAILAAPQLQNLVVLKLSHTAAKKEYEALADPAVFPHARRIELRERNLPPAIAAKLRARTGLELRDF